MLLHNPSEPTISAQTGFERLRRVLDDREKYLMQRCQDFEVAKNRELDEQEV